MEPTPVLIVIALICWLVYALFVWIRTVVHRRRLPEPSVAPGKLEIYQGQAFREMCRRAAHSGRRVMMTDYFAERGWNRADVMRILAELLKHKMIVVEGWRFGSYSVTHKGWTEYEGKFIWTGGEGVHISTGPGGFVVANVNSHHSVAHGGYGNRANAPDIPHQQLIDALRTDADTATSDEAVRAREYADDLAAAVEAQDADRTARVLGRINALLSTATAAFTLARGLLPSSS
ncbi:hypothetical protein [Streptomyces rapamycinicus]|uniref:Uncharacterized protein n=2 Tax=Streptomyces rapamycinicus TaxID=1226757 RepID=A0A0A0NUY5_STRRN|nr:hypothetical protein [Streptomyces rapamycinicus]AGP61426.1 hypothetical protein M271_50340 [Streptomyces rapamycinicus NRRL 5491]MBB4787389.1 hypothetical protein [Streptomyces rapamycinicus]RLV71735.1 hypothetical protein D3C57_144450 [Streptomyces rapamycinicus NRRL 5491]UTP36880.1 hypothetical protein LIV37_51335 [Streptomyces rapamycinicus NRRL 5491]